MPGGKNESRKKVPDVKIPPPPPQFTLQENERVRLFWESIAFEEEENDDGIGDDEEQLHGIVDGIVAHSPYLQSQSENIAFEASHF